MPNVSTTKNSMFSVLRFRDYRLLVIGQVISTLGDAFYAVALPWMILEVGTAEDLGQMLMIYGIPRIAGIVLGGIFGGRLGKNPKRGLYALLIGVTEGIVISFVPYVGGVWWTLPIFLVFGVCMGIVNVTLMTLIQQRVPRHLLGRTMGVVQFAALGLYPLSVLIGGYVTDAFGPSLMFPIAGWVLSAAFVIGLFEPGIRKPKEVTM